MNCDTALEQMSAMLDGDLTGDAREQLLAHLDACESCRNVYHELFAADAALRQDQAEPPAALRRGVMQAIHTEKRKKRSARLRGYLAAGLAAAAVLALVILSGFGVLQLPGFGDEGRASVSVGQSIQNMFAPELSGPETHDSAYAAQLSSERDCMVLVVWDCKGLDELRGLEYETPDGGGQLYCTDAETVQLLAERYAAQYCVRLYEPERGAAADAAAYILLLS